MPSFPVWPLVVLGIALVLVLGSKWLPGSRSLLPGRRRAERSVFGSPEPAARRRGPVEEDTVRLPAPDLPVVPGRPPYATAVFAAITPDTPRPPKKPTP
jgi:hypothetical protein